MNCNWDISTLLIFSSNGEPLIYYSHLTSIIIFAGLFGLTFLKLKEWPKNPFRLMALSYIGWLFCDLVLWANEDIGNVMFFWTLINLIEPLIFVSAFGFFYEFTEKHPFSNKLNWTIFGLLIPTLIMAPIGLSVAGFDYTSCDRNAIESIAAYYNYFLEFIFLSAIVLKTIHLFVSNKFINEKSKVLLISGGTSLLLLSFLVVNFLGTLTGDYVTSQYGHIAVPFFAGFLAYVTIKYESFEPRILITDIMVASIFILLLSLIFVNNANYQIYANSLTLVIMIPVAYSLMRGIRKEVKDRREIQKLAENLEQSNQQLDKANAHLKELDKAKDEFLSIATHQLKAPLSSIRGAASNLLDGSFGKITGKVKEPVENMMRVATGMVTLIDDYLNISRIEQGRMKYELSDFDLTNIVKMATEGQLAPAKKKGLDLTFTGDAALFVNADIGKITQVINNLVDNAVKYTPKGFVKVTVTTFEKEGKEFVRAMVADSGIGIAAEEIGKLFQRFSRAADANKTNTQGTGLGLYVAKQLTEGCGGAIRIESEGLGKGSQFIVEFPLVKKEATKTETTPRT